MRRTIAAVVSVAALAVAPTAFAFGGPNEAGKSGHFHPHSNPCQGPNDQPHCPGKH